MSKKSKLQHIQKTVPSTNPKAIGFSSSLKSYGHNENWYAFLIAVVAFCVYSNTLQNGYVLDDFICIRNNEFVKKGVIAIPHFFTSAYLQAPYNFYRPLPLSLYALEFQLLGFSPFTGHLVNVLLYAGCCTLLFKSLRRIFGVHHVAPIFWGCLLFTVHPIHTEIVANIKSSDELLSFFFGFSALLFFMNYSEKLQIKSILLGLFCLLLALFSKESSVLFAGIIPLVFLFFHTSNLRANFKIIAISLFTIGCFFTLRHFLLFSSGSNEVSFKFFENPLIAPPTISEKYATILWVLMDYIKLLFIPYPLICDYSFNSIPFVNFLNPIVWLSVSMYVFLVVFAGYRLIRFKKDPLAFGIVFYLITISIFSNIISLLGTELADRFLFFPSVGFCLIIPIIFEKYIAKSDSIQNESLLKNKKYLLFFVPVCCIFVLITVNRNNDWKDNLTLYSTDFQKSPDNAQLAYFVGAQQLEEVRFGQSEPEVKRKLLYDGISNLHHCITITPDYGWAHFSLSSAFLFLLKLDSAEAQGKLAVATSPIKDGPMNTLANVYMVQQKYGDAIGLLWQACALSPQNAEYPGNVGFCYLYLKNYDSATWYFLKSTRLDPSYSVAREYLPFAFKAAGLADSAKKYETIARQSEPGFSVDRLSLPKCGYYH